MICTIHVGPLVEVPMSPARWGRHLYISFGGREWHENNEGHHHAMLNTATKVVSITIS